MKDHLGSVRGTLDDTEAFLSWGDYGAYGNIIGTPPAGLEPVRYAGYFYIEELGLYENRRRFYDPLIGRFPQPHPLHYTDDDIKPLRPTPAIGHIILLIPWAPALPLPTVKWFRSFLSTKSRTISSFSNVRCDSVERLIEGSGRVWKGLGFL